MVRRRMVGAEIWKTPGGVVASGTEEAKEEILRIYDDEGSGFSALIDRLSLKVAQGETPEVEDTHPYSGARPPKLERPLSAMNERQLANYCVAIINHQRNMTGKAPKKVDWGNPLEKPLHHPDEIVDWENFTKAPRNMSITEFERIAKADPVKYPKAPFKPQKAHYFRKLIENSLASMQIDPEIHFDKSLYTDAKKKKSDKGCCKQKPAQTANIVETRISPRVSSLQKQISNSNF